MDFPPTTTMTPAQALAHAEAKGMTEVLIIGYDREGEFTTLSSRMTRADALWLIECARLWALKPMISNPEDLG